MVKYPIYVKLKEFLSITFNIGRAGKKDPKFVQKIVSPSYTIIYSYTFIKFWKNICLLKKGFRRLVYLTQIFGIILQSIIVLQQTQGAVKREQE